MLEACYQNAVHERAEAVFLLRIVAHYFKWDAASMVWTAHIARDHMTEIANRYTEATGQSLPLKD